MLKAAQVSSCVQSSEHCCNDDDDVIVVLAVSNAHITGPF